MRRRRAAKRQRLVAFALRRSLFRLFLVMAVTSILGSVPHSRASIAGPEPSQRHRNVIQDRDGASGLLSQNGNEALYHSLGESIDEDETGRSLLDAIGAVGVSVSSADEIDSSSPVEVMTPPWQEEEKSVMDPSWLSQPTEGMILKPQWNQNDQEVTANQNTDAGVDPLIEAGDEPETTFYSTYSPSYASALPGDLAEPVMGAESNADGEYGGDATPGTTANSQVLQAPWQPTTEDSDTDQILTPPWTIQDESQAQALTNPMWNGQVDEATDVGSSYGSAENQVMQGPWSQSEGDSTSVDVVTPPWAAQETAPSQVSADPASVYEGFNGQSQPYSNPGEGNEYNGGQLTGSTDGTGTGQVLSPPWETSATGTESQAIVDPVWTKGDNPSDSSGQPYYFTRNDPNGFQTISSRQGPSMPDGTTTENKGYTDGGQESVSGSSSGNGYGVTGVTYGQLPNLPSWSNSMTGTVKGSKGRGCSTYEGTPTSKSSTLKKKEKCDEHQRKRAKRNFHKDPLQGYPNYFQPSSAIPPAPSPVPTSRPTELQLVKFPSQAPLSRAPMMIHFTLAPVLVYPITSAPAAVSPPLPPPVNPPSSGTPVLVPLPPPSSRSPVIVATPVSLSPASLAPGSSPLSSSPSNSGAPAESEQPVSLPTPNIVGPTSLQPASSVGPVSPSSQFPIQEPPVTTPPSVPSITSAPASPSSPVDSESPVALTVSPSTGSPVSVSPAALSPAAPAPTSAIAPATAPISAGTSLPSSTAPSTTNPVAAIGSSLPTPTLSSPASGPPQASGAPSPGGSTGATAAPTATALQAEIKEVRVLAYPVTVEASGPIDLATAKETFFNVTMDDVQQYLDSYLGPVLQEFNMKITFHQSKTAVQHVGVTGSTVLVTSYFVLEMDFKVASESLETLQAFSQKKATDLVKGLFTGAARDKLLAELDEAGIRLESIRVVDSAFVTGGANDAATSDGTGAGEGTGSGIDTETSDEGQNGGGKSTLLYAGIASAGVVAFGAAAMYYAHRKRKRGWFDNAEESIEQSLYSNGGHGPPNGKVLPVLTPNGVSTIKTSKTSSLGSSQTSTRSRVKPAALTLRNKQNMKSQGSVSTLGSFMALNPVLEKLGIEDDGSEEKEDEETARLRRSDGGVDAPASNRSNFGYDYSLDGDNYSFRDLGNSGQPRGQNSTWSIDGLSIDDDSEAERIIDHARRRRWQDNSGASALGSLPDHSSELGYYDGSNTYYEGSASSIGPMD